MRIEIKRKNKFVFKIKRENTIQYRIAKQKYNKITSTNKRQKVCRIKKDGLSICICNLQYFHFTLLMFN